MAEHTLIMISKGTRVYTLQRRYITSSLGIYIILNELFCFVLFFVWWIELCIYSVGSYYLFIYDFLLLSVLTYLFKKSVVYLFLYFFIYLFIYLLCFNFIEQLSIMNNFDLLLLFITLLI